MMRIILCEGETDAILLGYYLSNMAGWKFNKKPKALKFQFSLQDNKCFFPYQNDKGEELFICGVGGKDSFKKFFETYLYDVIWLSPGQETEFKLAIVTDRDDGGIQEIENSILEQIKIIDELENNAWKQNIFKNSFGEQAIIDTLLIAIPKDKEGALENLLMDALSEDKYDANVVEICKQFVVDKHDEISKYVSTERLKIKAQLGVTLSIMNPDKAFHMFVEHINSIQWEKSQVLKENFSKLLEI